MSAPANKTVIDSFFNVTTVKFMIDQLKSGKHFYFVKVFIVGEEDLVRFRCFIRDGFKFFDLS